MDEKEKKQAHAEARLKMAKELMEYATQSQDGGEYFISINGMRMWVSCYEAVNMLMLLRVCIEDKD